MKTSSLLIVSLMVTVNISAQYFVYPASGNAVANELPTLVSEDNVRLVTTIRSFGCTPGGASTFRFGTDHLSTGAIYRNTSWSVDCAGSRDLIKFDFSTTPIRPLGMQFSIFDVDNGSDSVSVEIYSAGILVNYSYFLYSPTFVAANGAMPTLGFVGSASNNSGRDDNRGRIDIATLSSSARIDSILVYKYNNRNVSGNPSQSFAGFSWNTTIVLPVKLLYFNGFAEGNDVQLNWKATEEKGVAFYAIEYSEDGSHFFQLGNIIPAKGTLGGEAAYSYRQVIPSQASSLFFRLVSTDQDDKKYYSHTIKVKQNKQFSVTAFPTQFNSAFSVLVNSGVEMKGTVMLSGTDGRIVYKKQIVLQKGQTLYSVNITSFLSPGVYILTGEFDSEIKFRQKLIKL